ncbi:hypothetical protein B0H67DRAFT_559126 [Lasiosphaeris hirsuta]|uniref:NACHT domain-containing protein n=1 Tax=Lasiosphaeris hirsuta TaxID=260670 RepID=A0AA40E624_9PEZI|nr:hypothetical protein B0H67DRAFT_559126 [Lasiosphaeris hirsuta]
MDPLSISLGLAGVLPIIATVIRLAQRYRDEVKGASESISLLITELGLLESAIRNLDAFLGSAEGRDAIQDLQLDQSSALRTCSVACSAKLNALASKLHDADANTRAGGSRLRHLIWPLSERDHKKTVQELRNLTLWMQFSLSVDNIRIVCRSSDQMGQVMKQQLEQLQSLAKVQESTAKIELAVEDHASRLDAQRDCENRQKILDWISPAGHGQRHHAIQALRLEGTGDWLIRQPGFLKWSCGDETGSPNVLWCYGGPGTGKTVLVSVVIDHLLESASRGRSTVGFLYFDYKNNAHQSALVMILSVLRQFVEAAQSIADCVKAAYDSHQQMQRNLSLKDALKLISAVTSPSDTVYYAVVDAVDECLSYQRRPFLEALCGLARKSKHFRLMITGRPHADDVEGFFPECGKLEICANEQDMRRYINHELDIHAARDVIDHDFADEIVKQLIAVSRGMFLLAVLHLRTLVELTSVGAMQDVLSSASGSLSEAYRTTINRIQQQPASRSELAMQILQWVFFAARPLTVEELQDALCIKHGQARRDARYRPAPRIMLECCQGLILVDSEASLVRPAHYTVQEYLMENSCTIFPGHDLYMAQTCLAYLTLDDFASGPEKDMSGIKARLRNYPFLSYVSRRWYTHLSPLSSLKEIETSLWRFLGSAEFRATTKQASAFSGGFVWRYCQPEECLSHTAIHIACSSGLTSVVTELLNGPNKCNTQRDDINAQSYIGTTPVIHAASCGHAEVLRFLLDNGADPYIENAYGNALHCAAEAGKSGSIRALIRHGMPAGSDARYSRAPILCTLDRDSVEAFTTLTDSGASIEDLGENSRSEGVECEDYNHCELCGHCTPEVAFLHLAVKSDAGEIIRVIANGKLIDFKVRNKVGWTAFRLAGRTGRINAARALEEILAVADIERSVDRKIAEITDSSEYLAIIDRNERGWFWKRRKHELYSEGVALRRRYLEGL